MAQPSSRIVLAGGLNEHDRIGERKCYAQIPSDVTLTKAFVQSIPTTSRAICYSSFSTSCLCATSALQPFPFILLLKHRARGAPLGLAPRSARHLCWRQHTNGQSCSEHWCSPSRISFLPSRSRRADACLSRHLRCVAGIPGRAESTRAARSIVRDPMLASWTNEAKDLYVVCASIGFSLFVHA